MRQSTVYSHRVSTIYVGFLRKREKKKKKTLTVSIVVTY